MGKLNLSVDIIIPTYRPDAQFYELLDKLLHQTVKTKEKLVEDGSLEQAELPAYLNRIIIMNLL